MSEKRPFLEIPARGQTWEEIRDANPEVPPQQLAEELARRMETGEVTILGPSDPNQSETRFIESSKTE